MGDWADIRNAGISPVASAFGLVEKRPGSPRHGLSPCPACGADDRSTTHHHDPHRGPIGLTKDGMGWCCHVCDVRGDAVTLASYLAGQGGRVNSETAEACKRKGLLRDDGASRAPIPPPPPRKSRYIDSKNLRLFVNELVPIDSPASEGVNAWLMSRKIDPSKVLDKGIIKALPKNATIPSWARCMGKPWSKAGYRLIAGLYDSGGRLRSFHARAVVADADPKGANPSGYELGGLLLACPLARLWLHGDKLGDETTPAVDHVKKTGIIIVEGLPDWISQVSSYSDADQDAPVVLGIMSGSWTQEFADKVPDGCHVLIATDLDEPGEKYAKTIKKTLGNRAILHRWKISEG